MILCSQLGASTAAWHASCSQRYNNDEVVVFREDDVIVRSQAGLFQGIEDRLMLAAVGVVTVLGAPFLFMPP